MKVLLGEHTYNTDTETTHIRASINKIVDHPDYNAQTTDNDYSMLKLKNAVNFAAYPHIRPICLPTDTSEVRFEDVLMSYLYCLYNIGYVLCPAYRLRLPFNPRVRCL